MIPALLNGKLSRTQENMEDVLTSCVFQLLEYAPLSEGLFPFLAAAESLVVSPGEITYPLAPLTKRDFAENASVEFEYWPFFETPGCERNCEPDLLINIAGSGQQNFLVCVEAKYNSGKSSEADATKPYPTDQLAVQWNHLHRIALNYENSPTPVLIYLTADVGPPRHAIEASVANFNETRPSAPQPNILFLSWRLLSRILRNTDSPPLMDIWRLVERLGLFYFDGFSPLPVPSTFAWEFAEPPFRWGVVPCVPTIQWTFQ